MTSLVVLPFAMNFKCLLKYWTEIEFDRWPAVNYTIANALNENLTEALSAVYISECVYHGMFCLL